MLDTVKFYLNTDNKNIDFNRIRGGLDKFEETIKGHGITTIHGFLGNLRFDERRYVVNIEGSLPKFFQGHNFRPLSRTDLRFCIENISDTLGIDVGRMGLSRVDISDTVRLSHKPKCYFDCFVEYPRLEREARRNGVYFINKSRHICCYGKVEECVSKKQRVPSQYQGLNMLKIENVLRKGIAERLPFLSTVSDLYTEKGYLESINFWEQEFNSIIKIDTYVSQLEGLTSKLDYFTLCTIEGMLKRGGVRQVLRELEMLAALGRYEPTRAGKTRFKRHKQKVRSLLHSYQQLNPHFVSLKEELENAVAAQAKENRQRWINPTNLHKAYNKITSVQGSSLMEINQQIWELIRGATFPVKQMVHGKEEFINVSYIDYHNPDNNDFLVVNQLRCHGRTLNSIPDLIVFLNGMPIAVIECKAPGAQNAFDKAYSDLRFYESNSEKLFHFNQIMAGVYGVGGKYGAICASDAFYSVFKTKKDDLPSFVKTEQDKLIYSLFEKNRLLDLIRHFVIYELDEGRIIKKLPRYQQIRATNKTIEKLKNGAGGVVWHTQGSGKSITMAYVTRKLQAPEYGFDNPTVIVMTDRKDLDRQITNTFRAVGFKNVNQASSVKHLDKLLRNDYGGIITTTLQKFQENDPDDTTEEDQTEQEEHENLLIEKQIKDKVLTKITKVLVDGKWVERDRVEITLEELSNKENLFVMVDEAHRSQYGFLASFMRTVLPHAKFVAFTGTPLSKEDKSTLAEFYGGEYLDVYTIKESVADGATVELLYDEGIAQLEIKKKELDAEFEAKFGNESEEKKNLLKQKALNKYQLSNERMTDISRHLLKHFSEKIYPNGHKAMLVCDGRFAAIRYKQIIEQLREEGVHNFETKVVVSIGSPKSDDIAKEYYETLDWNKKNPNAKKPIWVVAPEDIKAATDDFKLPYGDVTKKEKSGKKKYDNTAILIVSDMLLTGYDAPIASCLYLDKPLKEHNLLQAIARVNRSGKGKDAGFIIDYYGITEYLIQALEIFSGDIRRSDILKNISEEFPRLELNHNKLVEFFKPVKIDRNYKRDDFIDAAVLYIEPIDLRDQFKNLLKEFNKSIAIVLPNTKAMRFFSDFKLFNEIRLRARNAYPDDEELKVTKEESQLLQQLIDDHLRSEGIENLLNEPVSIIDKDKFKQEIQNASPATRELKMRNNLKHVIKVGLDKNPDFYKPLAQRLEELLKQDKEKRITQTALLKAYADIQDDIINHQKEGEEKGFATERERAIFDSMKIIFTGDAEDATRTIFDLISGELSIIGWEYKSMVQKDIENKLTRFLKTKMDRSAAKAKAQELIDVLKRNNNA